MKSLYKISEDLQNILDRIPEVPGVYQYFNKENKIIYVGKAKNLRKRIYSYFQRDHSDSPKTRILVRNIRDLKYIVVDTEADALLLENNLIKQFQPRYNVLLKDDKSYPSICIKKENFPRIFMTRNIIKDGSEYYGPYSSISAVYAMISMIREIYKIRTCKYPLFPRDIQNGKYRPCLEYHIKNCKGPCIGKQSGENYNKNVEEIRQILKGNISSVSNKILDEIKALAEDLKFEEAKELKDKYDLIEAYKVKSLVASSSLDNIDVFAYEELDQSAIINYLYISKGCIVKGYTLEYKKKVEERKEEILSSAIFEFKQRFKTNAREMIVPFSPDIVPRGTIVTIPIKGEKKHVLKLSELNVKQYKVDLLKQKEKLNPAQRTTRILSTMKKDLRMDVLPQHIECFDNSNIQGTNPVASCVVFRDAKPAKKEYRHFNIKTVIGANDFASMEEILYRRYTRLIKEEKELPQLVIVDGGKGQLSSATRIFEDLGLINKIKLIGIAKHLEEIFFPYDSTPLYIDKNSETLKIIQQLRDEAHRFGITFHRKKRSIGQIHSELDDIKGIGPKTKELLLKKYKSVKRIKEAKQEELTNLIGKNKALILKTYFNNKEK